MSTEQLSHGERKEAQAFDHRIDERINAGLVPDLRRAVKCEFFYKSIWRDPQFVRLFLGEIADTYLRMLRQYAGPGLRILDVGCGAGYLSLELARAGHHVEAIDISERCIEVARKTLQENCFKTGFGSLNYRVMPFRQVTGLYHVVLFSGSLHHFSDAEEQVMFACDLLGPRGLILCYEPCHEQWRMEDAAQVALVRLLLSLTGVWYEPFLDTDIYKDQTKLESYVTDVHTEYVTERDKTEAGGQSPNDNSSSGQDILAALRGQLDELEYKPGFSFIYRLLGGLRGSDKVVSALATLLTVYDQMSVKNGYMKPNGFFFIGRKTEPGLTAP
jgi:SAM-dependent methyltransferase